MKTGGLGAWASRLGAMTVRDAKQFRLVSRSYAELCAQLVKTYLEAPPAPPSHTNGFTTPSSRSRAPLPAN
jgi:hypothetical protein